MSGGRDAAHMQTARPMSTAGETLILAALSRLQLAVNANTNVLNAILAIQQKEMTMSGTLASAIQALTAEVAQETTVEQSAIELISGIPGLIAAAIAQAQAAGATPAQLQAITDAVSQITASSTSLAAAVTANTPATAPATDAASP